ncbi:MAG: TRAP transporter small permease [Thalassobaculaceae bacterium]|uniref:TRAP transporter small permease subunit n=1 Tax=Roseitalea porphyridii TaxID=1852022 RepID=UPI0032EEA0D9
MGLLLLIALVVWEVFLRYVVNAPTTWGNELITYLFAGYILLGGGYTLLHRDHVAMDIIYSQLSPRKKSILDVLTAGFVLIYCLVLLQQTGIMTYEAWEAGQRAGTDWGPPLYPVYAAMPIGAGLLLLQAIAKLFRDLYTTFTGEELLPDPAANKHGEAAL